MGESLLKYQYLIYSILPTCLLVALVLLVKPYSIILEILLYFWATLWNILVVSQAIMSKSLIDVPSLYIILTTSKSEAFSFLNLGLSLEVFIIAVVLVIFPLIVWYFVRKNVQVLPTYKQSFIFLLSTLVLLLLPIWSNINPFIALKNIGIKESNIDRNIRKLYMVQYATYLPEALKMGKLNAFTPQNVVAKFEKPQNFVLVVLESSNRNNFSLNGYTRKTNPQLEKLDIYAYQDVISPTAVTMYSIPHMYTFSNLKQSEQITTIYDIFKVAGFETHLFEGYPASRPNDIIFHVANRADYKHTKDGYDKDLFEKALGVINANKDKKNLLVIQTMGAHYTYSDQYPKDYEAFTDTAFDLFPNADMKLRNEYDTAIKYLDEIIADFINALDDKENTVLLITSDHGEEVGHYATINTGRTNSTKLLSCFEIPLFLYATNEYKKSLGNLVFDTLRPYQTDNLLHSIIDLAHIETELFKPELSLFNKEYKEQVRTVQGNEYYSYKEKVDKEREEKIKEILNN